MSHLVILSTLVVCAFGGPVVPRIDGHVIGGQPVDIKNYPHQVSLLRFDTHICGGSIISKRYVITAALCTAYDSPSSALSIRTGSSIHNEGGAIVDVKTVHQHPQWNVATIDYDFTILELASDLIYGVGTVPIGLPTPNQTIASGADAQTSGWGNSWRYDDSPNYQLRALTLQMVSNDDCNAKYGQGVITDRMICAGAPGGKSSCQFESGGPLIVDGQLIGVKSWSRGCDYPTVYASVPNLRSYITKVTGL